LNEKYEILIIFKSINLISPIEQKLKEHKFNSKLEIMEENSNIESLLHRNVWDLILIDYKTWRLYEEKILDKIKENKNITSYIVIGEDIEQKEIISMMKKGIKDYIRKDNLKRLIPSVTREINTKNTLKKAKNFHFSQCLLEEEFQQLLKISKFIIYKLDLNSNFLDVNSVFTEFLGYTKEDLDSLNIYELIHPQDKMFFAKGIKKVLDGKFVKNTEYRFKTKNRKYIELSSSQAPLFDDQNKIIGILCMSKDLTEFKKAEKFIEDRIHRQAIIAKFGLEAIAEKNLDKLFQKAASLLANTLNVKFTKILELLPNKKLLKLRAGVGWHEDLVGNATVENNENSQAGYTLLKTEPVIVENLKKETRFFAPKLLADHNVISGMSVIIQGEESPFGILGAHTDKFRKFSDDDINFLQSIANILANVILRNSTEKELKKSEEKYRMLTEQSLLGTIIIANEKIIFANRGISNILGFSIDELLSWDLNSIIQHIHPEDISNVIEKYQQILDEKITSFESEIRVEKKNEDFLYIRLYLKKIQFQGKSALYLNVIDISEQKKNESLLESSLAEKEILLKEIHHRVKNNLQIISSLIVLQEQYINDEKVSDIFKEFQNRIKVMALIHQSLYNSKNLNKIDLSTYVKKLVNNLFKIYSVDSQKINLQLNIEDIDLKLDKAIPFGLIINELVTNSLKHAFSKNENGIIGVSLKKKRNNRILLDVYDNGKGLPKELNYKDSESLGLNLIHTMTKQINGKIEIKKKNGTHVKITW